MDWFGHVERIGEERRVKRIMNAEMEGRILVGRPLTRWKDVHRKDLESSRLTLEQAAEEARDRETWKNIVLASSDYSAAGSYVKLVNIYM